MPLTITTEVQPVGTPILEAPATIEDLARQRGASVPRGITFVAFTKPVIRAEPNLQYHTRNNNTEFRFNTGTLKLILRQEIHLSQALGLCARTIWLQHEQKHVRDNEQLMTQMDGKLRADQEFADILVTPTEWRARSKFDDTQQIIREIVGDVFERLTTAAAARHDTMQEYRRVERQVRLRCGQSVARRLNFGMYGQGIDIVQLALNNHPSGMERLLVDGVFGPLTKRRVQEFQGSKDLEQDGIVGPKTRQALDM